MTNRDFELLKVLAEIPTDKVIRSVLINEKLGVVNNRENSWRLRQRLGRLKKQGLVADFKRDLFDEKKFWRITKLGRAQLQLELDRATGDRVQISGLVFEV